MGIVNFHMWKCTQECVFSLCSFTQLEFGELPHAEIHCLMWIPSWGKVYFRGIPWMWICTVLSELQLVKINKNICNSAQVEIRFSACGSSREILHFHKWKYIKNCEFPMRKYSFLRYFHMRKFKRESEFHHVNLHADLWISVGKKHAGKSARLGGGGDFHMQKCMQICEFPHAEIHTESKVYYSMR